MNRSAVRGEVRIRMEMIVALVLHESHRLQAEETMDAIAELGEGFYKSYLVR